MIICHAPLEKEQKNLLIMFHVELSEVYMTEKLTEYTSDPVGQHQSLHILIREPIKRLNRLRA